MNTKLLHFLKKTLRVLVWCVVSIIALLLFLAILIQVPSVQNFAKDQAISYLQNKIKTKVSLDRIDVNCPKEIVLEGFYFEDQKKDTLLIGKRLEADVDLFKLLSSELEINSISLQNASANISRNKNGAYNFDYIIKAFESKEPVDPNSKPFKISVPNIDLDGLKLVLNQDAVEKIAEVSVNTLDTISKREDFSLKLGKISLSKIDISYDTKDSKLGSGIFLGNLELSVNEIDLNKQLLDFDTFELKNLKGN